MKELKELLGAKSKIDPVEKEAKLAAIKGMRKMAGGMMSDDMKSMKKVTVAAPDEAGLEAGLEKAQDLVGSEDLSTGFETEESNDNNLDEVVEQLTTPEEIDELMQKLAEKKAALIKE